MAIYTEVIDTNFNFPNIDVYKRMKDGVHNSYKVYPHEGYVMYDTTDIVEVENPETGEMVQERYYCRQAGLPLNYNFDNFSFVAVLESDVPSDHIFCSGNNHAVM